MTHSIHSVLWVSRADVFEMAVSSKVLAMETSTKSTYETQRAEQGREWKWDLDGNRWMCHVYGEKKYQDKTEK